MFRGTAHFPIQWSGPIGLSKNIGIPGTIV